ncbi:DUF4395 family protein [Anaeromyxobacter oryzae]|uniref:DUF4395 domain-containing protein n=1 Tax=Anaeromyxobacter oryzae TaxID=2918170 RepID=A0ABM7X0T4_9BACT|nr:DUF4395 family protein [Anaeromyxobacter oryzae]BDG05360.1 hypothetical protein AMOR_43560 [Anaeromyxobacter oryzae]
MSEPVSSPVVDARAVRLSQGLVAALIGAAAALRASPVLLAPAAHLAASAFLGPRGNVVAQLFRRLVRPHLTGDAPEDARPPRFASTIGAVFLFAALLAHAAGLAVVGWALAGAVAGLALLSAATGLCVGCRLYWLVALVRRARAPRAGVPRA